MVVCFTASAISLFGAPMLLRRRSSSYAYIGACVALLPLDGCGQGFVQEGGLFPTLPEFWGLIVILLVAAGLVQSRSLRISLGRAFAGLLTDLGLGVLWLVAIVVFEMIGTADGGPGFEQYSYISLSIFAGTQFLLPLALRFWWPVREYLPPRIPVAGEYPRP